MTTAPPGVICHRQAGTCHDQPMNFLLASVSHGDTKSSEHVARSLGGVVDNDEVDRHREPADDESHTHKNHRLDRQPVSYNKLRYLQHTVGITSVKAKNSAQDRGSQRLLAIGRPSS